MALQASAVKASGEEVFTLSEEEARRETPTFKPREFVAISTEEAEQAPLSEMQMTFAHLAAHAAGKPLVLDVEDSEVKAFGVRAFEAKDPGGEDFTVKNFFEHMGPRAED